ncbi:MAG: ATP-binding protein [Deltaproteobacteria bacterium]|nr:ATP-binding protein [Deltaproteobacteria bacterium]
MFHRAINISKSNSFFLFGARGTGKSTLIKERFVSGNTIYIDLLKFSEMTRLQADPEELLRRIAPSTDWVVIDEIQKVPALLDTIHYFIEARNLTAKFALTGSRARKLKLGGANLLAGRAFVYELYPLTSSELGDDFDLMQAIQWGLLPGVFAYDTNSDKKLFLEAYANTYLKEEVWDEHLVKDLEPFRKFLQVAAQCNGTVINYSKIALDVRVDTKTVQRYFQILEDTLVGCMIEPYSPSLRKRQRTNPKFYFIDPGIVRALTNSFAMDISPATLGFGYVFEHFVILEFLKRNSYLRKNYQFSFIRDTKNREVDLVIERPGEKTALVEIKSTDTVRAEHIKQLHTFLTDYPECEAFCISRDETEQSFGKVISLHWSKIFDRIGL